MVPAEPFIRRTADQAIQRAEHLPEQLIQRVIIDIRGQDVSEGQRWSNVARIADRSNGGIDTDSIEFKRDLK